MLEGLKDRRTLLVGLVLALIGIALLVVALPFAAFWLEYLPGARLVAPVNSTCGPTTSGSACGITTYVLVGPTSFPVFATFAFASSVVFVLALLMTGIPGRKRSVVERDRFVRWARVLLLVTSAWMVLWTAAAAILGWFAIPGFPWAQYQLVISMIIVPVILLVVGGAFLWKEGRRWLRERSPGAPG